jgi:hypothetical protein
MNKLDIPTEYNLHEITARWCDELPEVREVHFGDTGLFVAFVNGKAQIHFTPFGFAGEIDNSITSLTSKMFSAGFHDLVLWAMDNDIRQFEIEPTPLLHGFLSSCVFFGQQDHNPIYRPSFGESGHHRINEFGDHVSFINLTPLINFLHGDYDENIADIWRRITHFRQRYFESLE